MEERKSVYESRYGVDAYSPEYTVELKGAGNFRVYLCHNGDTLFSKMMGGTEYLLAA
jgi:hypothetical protein